MARRPLRSRWPWTLTAPRSGPPTYKLKSNQSNQTGPGGNKENSGCEYRFADGTTQDHGGNKKDNPSFNGGLSGPRYAAGCHE